MDFWEEWTSQEGRLSFSGESNRFLLSLFPDKQKMLLQGKEELKNESFPLSLKETFLIYFTDFYSLSSSLTLPFHLWVHMQRNWSTLLVKWLSCFITLLSSICWALWHHPELLQHMLLNLPFNKRIYIFSYMATGLSLSLYSCEKCEQIIFLLIVDILYILTS